MTSARPSLLHLHDDTLECVILWRLVDARSNPEHDPPFQAADAIAQVCTRFRKLALGRASYWSSLRVCEHTKVDEVKLMLARAGRDFPINIQLQVKKQFSVYSAHKRKLGNPDAYLLAYAAMHRARAIVITRRSWTRRLPEVELTLVKPADYDSRPLEYLSFNSFASDAIMQLVGPRLTQIDLRRVSNPISLGQLEQIIIAAPRLASFTLKRTVVLSEPVAGDLTLTEPSAALARDRVHCLSHLALADLNCSAVVTDLLCRYYPLTPTNSPSVLLSPSNADFDLKEIDYVPIWVNLKLLGSPTHILVNKAGDEWNLRFTENRKRGVRVSKAQLEDSSPLRNLLQSALAATPSLEVRDMDSISPVFWLKLWCGDTWNHLKQLELELEFPDDYGAEDEDLWRPREQQRIRLPALQTLIILARYHDNFDREWGAQCAAILDMLEIPSTVSVDICPSRSDDDLREAIDAAYLVRHGRVYFKNDA